MSIRSNKACFPPSLSKPEPARHPPWKATPLPLPPASTAGRAKRTRSSHAPGLELKAAAATSSTVHHIEQHLRVNVHASAPLHWEPPSLLCKHFAWVDEVFAAVVSFTLLGVTQRLVSLSDILESLRSAFVVRIFVGVMYNRQLAICLFDLIIRGILLHSKDLVVVLAFRFLEFQLCVADFLCDSRLFGVGFRNGFVFVDGGLPVAGFAKGAGFGFAGFCIGGVESEGAGAV